MGCRRSRPRRSTPTCWPLSRARNVPGGQESLPLRDADAVPPGFLGRGSSGADGVVRLAAGRLSAPDQKQGPVESNSGPWSPESSPVLETLRNGNKAALGRQTSGYLSSPVSFAARAEWPAERSPRGLIPKNDCS